MFRLCFLFCFLLTGCLMEQQPKDATQSTDVIIYGGTSSAVIAAVAIARRGHSVKIVCPDTHLGGLTASGLGWTDTGNKSVIGGFSREFYQRVYSYYQKDDTWKWERRDEFGNAGQGTPAIDGDKRTMWIFEPHIAEAVFEDMIREEGIEVIRNKYLDRKIGITKNGKQIKSITTLSGEVFEAEIFIDATYEGDLMAAAGVSYHVGREANSVYDEKWNGVQTGVLHHRHHFSDRKISPYQDPDNPSSGVLAKISTQHPGIKGEGDNKVQAYCFRTCLTKVPENRIPFPKPSGYDPLDYELLLRIFEDGWRETFDKFDAMPNHKTDVNNHGPFSFDNIGMNYDYPEASYARRKEIVKEHELYQKGLLYFIANDPRVPEEVRNEMSQWGLSKDEFVDNDHWPHQIYVREARRMIGEYIMTEHEVLGDKEITESIGMGSYTLDSHNVQRYIKADGFVQNEGDIGVRPEQPYAIALGCILPKEEECDNLLVTVAVSSSHIAFGSIRMEPVFMILGHSAGTVASLALHNDSSVHTISYEEIKQELLKEGQILKI